MNKNYYINVLPNQDHTGNMVLSVDYDLYNTTTHETIHVEDAKAVVPQAYMTWNPNYAYTYLFKISDNTNGYTGGGTLPSGLWPITFDAVTVAATDVSEGTITTVSTPSITTYQNGSVSDAGITYANASRINVDTCFKCYGVQISNVKILCQYPVTCSNKLHFITSPSLFHVEHTLIILYIRFVQLSSNF